MALYSCFSKIKQFFIKDDPPLFAHYSPINSTVLLIIRIISGLYLTGFIIYDSFIYVTLVDRFKYYTNVSFYLTCLYFIVVVQSRFIRIAKGLDHAAELMFEVVFSMQFNVVLMYWATIYALTPTQKADFVNINWHGVPLFFLLLDFIFCSYRFAPSRYICYLVVLLTYSFCLNLPYSLVVREIYGGYWKTYLTYVTLIAEIVAGALIYLLGWALYRKCKFQKIMSQNLNKNDELAEQNLGSDTNAIPKNINTKEQPIGLNLN